jgi:hypothetical protein
MQHLLRDAFSHAISRAKQNGIWEKMTLAQKEALVTKYLLLSYEHIGKTQQTGVSSEPVMLK